MAEDAKSKIDGSAKKGRTAAPLPEADLSARSSDRGAVPVGGDPLEELRNLVMSIEWEITDDVMDRFVKQIDALKLKYGKDRILVMFLQLLGSLGLYVRTYKAKAHPNAFKLLQSVYSGFDKVMESQNLAASEKKKLLYIELNRYKELKEQIDDSKTATRGERKGVIPESVGASRETAMEKGERTAGTPDPKLPEPPSSADRQGEPSPAEILEAIDRLARNMQAQFEKLLSEIQSLKKRR